MNKMMIKGGNELAAWIHRSQVLSNYRSLVRTAYAIPDPGSRASVLSDVQRGFRANAAESDMKKARRLLSDAMEQASMLSKALSLSK